MKDHLERLSHSDTSTSSQTRKKSLSEILATSRGKEQKSAESLQLEHKKWEQAEYHAHVEAAEEKRGLPPSQESNIWLGHDKKRYAGIGGMDDNDNEWECLSDNLHQKAQWFDKNIQSIRSKHKNYQDAIDRICNNPASGILYNNERREELEMLNDNLKDLKIKSVHNAWKNVKFPHGYTTPCIKPSHLDRLNLEKTITRDLKQKLRQKIETYS